jgi:peptidoglycan/LPS O-acetylase OafA/YrhL
MTSITIYRPAIDLVRFIAAFGVVAAHSFAAEQDWIGHLSLGLFLTLTAFLSVQSMQRAGGQFPWIARARRLVLPWLFWSLFFRLVDLRISDDPEKWQVLTDPWTLLIGSTIHLWFLPFVMLAMVLVEPSGRMLKRAEDVRIASVMLVALSLPLFWIHRNLALPEPVSQWTYGLPLYVYGLLLGHAHAMNRPGWPLAAIVVVSIGGFAVTGHVWSLMPFVAAVAFELAWRFPARGPAQARWMKPFGEVSFGIYLVHPFFALLCWKLLGGDMNLWLLLVLTFVMSWAATWVMRRSPHLKSLV